MAEQLDCQSCGACCVPELDEGSYAHVEPAEARRIPRRLMVVDRRLHSMAVVYDRRGNCRCAALRGVLGKSVRCAIYADRPRVCREFQPGSRDCLSSREQLREAGQLG